MNQPDLDVYTEDSLDIQYYLSLLLTVARKYYPYIIVLAIVSSGFAYNKAKSARPTYTATLTMHLAEKNNMMNINDWYYGSDGSFQGTQIGIMQSKMLMSRVVKELGLHKSSEDRPPPELGLRAQVMSWLGFEPDKVEIEPVVPVVLTASEEAALIDDYAGWLSGSVTTASASEDYTNLINISITWSDPQLAADITNSVARNYMKMLFEKEVEQAIGGRQYLAERLIALREDMRRSEKLLQDFLEEKDIVDTSGSDVQQELAGISTRLLNARSERIRLRDLYNQMKSFDGSRSDVSDVPAIANHPRIVNVRNTLFEIGQRRSELAQRYGPRHNKMLALEAEARAASEVLIREVRDVIVSVKAEYDIAIKNEDSLETAQKEARDRIQSSGREDYLLFDLQQDVQVKRDLYSSFSEMQNQSDAAAPEENTNIWIVDPATVPGAANLPSARNYVLAAIALSVLGGLGLGLLLEMNRSTVATEEEVEKSLGHVALGTLPLIKSGSSSASGLPLSEYVDNPTSYFAETIRSLRTSLLLRDPGNELTRYVVTSTDAHEGKTSVALNLAVSFSHMKKALIIDCDLRRPSVERALSPDHHHLLGLTDILAGAVELQDCLVEHPETGVTFLPAGSRTLNPLEVLSSSKFSMLLNVLGGLFDVIVFDTPPCSAVSDGYVVATQGDCVVFVLKAGSTKVPAARNVLRKLNALQIDVAGVLLNQVDFESGYYGVHKGSFNSYQDYTNISKAMTKAEGVTGQITP